jgi:hypothetical protein
MDLVAWGKQQSNKLKKVEDTSLSGTLDGVEVVDGVIQVEEGKTGGMRVSEPLSLEGLRNVKRSKVEWNGDASVHTKVDKVRYAGKFDGVDDYISTQKPEIDNALTVSAWVKFTGSSVGEISNGNQWDTGPFYGWRLRYNAFRIGDGTLQSQTVILSNILTVGKWYLITGTYKYGELCIYLDGVLGTSKSVFVDYAESSANTHWIGKYAGYSYYLRANIIDVRIYNRALSADEVLSLYEGNHVSQGLVGWWPLNKDALDYSGNGNHGTVYGMTYEKQDQVVPAFTKSARFDGVDDIIVASNTNYNITNECCLSFWVFPTAISTPNSFGGTILSSSQDPYNYGFWVTSYNGTNIRSWGFDNTYTRQIQTVNNPITINAWNHVFIKNIKGGTVDIYVNGVFNTSGSIGDTDFNSVETYIGDLRINRGLRYQGNLHNVCIYNRVLSALEVQQLYEGQHITDGLVAYYPLDGDALDYSGNGNDGTNYGATFVEDNPEWNQQANGESIALPDDITQKQVWVREKLVDGQTLQGSRAVVKGRRRR